MESTKTIRPARRCLRSLVAFACAISLAGCGGDDAAADGGATDLGLSAIDLAGPEMPLACIPACTAPLSYCNAAGICVGCLADADCPLGKICRVTSVEFAGCVDGCASDARCPTGRKCCGGRCADLLADAANCGACGQPCTSPHAAGLCTAGKCGPGACAAGWADCNKDPADGCEINLHVDNAHCTGCGMKCALANAVGRCADGCYLAACLFGFADCNHDEKDGCEVPVGSDAKNCGACGTVCKAANAAPACANGVCGIGQCNVGYTDCDRSPANGCEVQTATDAANCGDCGTVCPMGQACKNGSCTCPMCNFPNAQSSCVNGVCQMGACVQGFADCNAMPADGCEINLNANAMNCGTCGKACAMGQGCAAGVCVNDPCVVVLGDPAHASDQDLWNCGTAQRLGACVISTPMGGACTSYVRSSKVCTPNCGAPLNGTGCSDKAYYTGAPFFCMGAAIPQSACMLRYLILNGFC